MNWHLESLPDRISDPPDSSGLDCAPHLSSVYFYLFERPSLRLWNEKRSQSAPEHADQPVSEKSATGSQNSIEKWKGESERKGRQPECADRNRYAK